VGSLERDRRQLKSLRITPASKHLPGGVDGDQSSALGSRARKWEPTGQLGRKSRDSVTRFGKSNVTAAAKALRGVLTGLSLGEALTGEAESELLATATSGPIKRLSNVLSDHQGSSGSVRAHVRR
jgi:hypothetical protein